MIDDLGLYKEGEKMDPLNYSTGKDQVDVVDEILEKFEDNDIVLLNGNVGSGKSVVSVRTALEMGGGVISVPTKVLGRQYREDYNQDMAFRINGDTKRVSSIEGRSSFRCPATGGSATDSQIPCLKTLAPDASRIQYLEENCPHWSYLMKYKTEKATNLPYPTVDGGEWYYCTRPESNCPYFDQYREYLKSDVIIMNSAKFKIELSIGRLPKKSLYVVDECDEFMDSLAMKLTFRDGLITSISNDLDDLGKEKIADELERVWKKMKDNEYGITQFLEVIHTLLDSSEISDKFPTLYWKLDSFLNNADIMVVDEEDGNIIYTLPDPEPVLKRKIKKAGGKWLMMSATTPSRDVLNSIFGIDPPVVKGEPRMPGKLRVEDHSVGEVTYKKWQRKRFKKKYQRDVDAIIEEAERPGLCLVHSFKYLPNRISDTLKRSDGTIKVDGITYSTTLDRGANMDGMESLIILKLPFPSLGDPLYQGMKERLGDRFWTFYRDKAERELVQQIGRTLRSDDDDVKLYSPDEKVLKKARELEPTKRE